MGGELTNSKWRAFRISRIRLVPHFVLRRHSHLPIPIHKASSPLQWRINPKTPKKQATPQKPALPKMPLIATRIPRRSLLHLLSTDSAATESRDQKLNRIADEFLALTKAEREDYSALFRRKLGLTHWVSESGLAAASAAPPVAADSAASEEKKEEKTEFDIKLEKFEAPAKIKVIKEVRVFTDLGLKEAKELVEKAPVVVKKGVLKEDAEVIVAKLKEIGAAAVLE